MPVRPTTHKPRKTNTKRHVVQSATSDEWKAWYTHSKWRRIRAQHLARQPLCVFCQRRDKVTLATVVDHVEPHRGNKARFYAGPFQSLCKPCHDSEKKRQENSGRVEPATPWEPVLA